MKHLIAIASAFLSLSIILPAQVKGNKKVMEAYIQDQSTDIGSTTTSAPETPRQARSLTQTEHKKHIQSQIKPTYSYEYVSTPTQHQQQPQPSIDTIYLSDLYTTHMIFSTDISYADLSNQKDVAGKVIEQAKNKLALKARGKFSSTASVSVEETNGQFHTYILKYRRYPQFLIIDTRPGADMWALAQLDTISLSTLYTSHLIFSSDVVYADISQPTIIAGKLVDQGKNKLAAKARTPFITTANLSVEEANGVFHTYIVKFEENPASLIKDTREENKPILGSISGEKAQSTITGSFVRNTGSQMSNGGQYGGVSSNAYKRNDAPTLGEIIKYPQEVFHLSTKKYNVRLTCENLYSYSDIIYMTFRLDNNSGISYEVSDATFVIESNNGNKRKIVFEENIFPKNRFGGLTAQAHGVGKICYSFDKIALGNDQVLKVYLYESGGQRNIVLTLSYKDINNAIVPIN